MSAQFDINRYGKVVWEGHRPTGQIPTESPSVAKARYELYRAEEESRRTSNMIEIIKKVINKSSFLENPNKYLEEWNQKIVETQRTSRMCAEDDFITKPMAREFLAKHIVRGKLNRVAVNKELQELSRKIDACNKIIEEHPLKDDDQEFTLIYNS